MSTKVPRLPIQPGERLCKRVDECPLAAAVQHAADAIEITDPHGVILHINPAFVASTGFTLDEAVGRTPAELLRSGAHDKAYYDEMWSVISSGGVWQGPLVGKRKDGTHFHQEVTIAPVRDERGEIVHFVAVKRDVTSRKELESQLAVSDRRAMLGVLSASIVHELANPLCVARGGAEVIRDEIKRIEAPDELRGDLAELVSAMEQALDHASAIIGEVRMLAHERADDQRPVEVRDVVDAALRLASAELRRCAKLTRDYRAAPMVRASRTRLGQVILNLLVNAAQAIGRYAAGDNEIRVVIAEQPGHAIVEVHDTGGGIPLDAQGRVFEPFFTTKAPGEGSGLGLPICRDIIQGVGGDISFESQPGQGTVFRIELPLASQRPSSDPAAVESPAR